MNVEDFFYTHPVFRQDEFARFKPEQGADKKRAIRKALHYYTKAGRLLNVRREIYAVVPPGLTPEETLVDPYLLASKAAEDSVLAYHTALELHGVAYSVFEQFTFLTAHKTKPFEFRGQWYQPVALPLALKKSNNSHFGVEQWDRQGVGIKIPNLARTFVDVLYRLDLSGGWEEAVRSINNMAALDVHTVVKYCLLFNNRILAAKVGYFLERRKGAFAVGHDVLKPLLERKPLTPQSLVSHKKEGRLIKKWNIILPLYVLNESWEEPNHDV